MIKKLGEGAEIVNQVIEINKAEATSEDVVKVILNKLNEIIYFSRSVIPNNAEKFYRQLGIIGYKFHAKTICISRDDLMRATRIN